MPSNAKTTWLKHLEFEKPNHSKGNELTTQASTSTMQLNLINAAARSTLDASICVFGTETVKPPRTGVLGLCIYAN